MSEEEPSSKGQLQYRNRKLRKEASRQFLEKLGPTPPHVREFLEAHEGNIGNPMTDQLGPTERAPAHVVNRDEYRTFNTTELQRVSREAANIRSENRNNEIADLRFRYHRIWNRVGAAAVIASQEAKRGRKISERTVRNYIKKTPQK